MPSRTNSSSSTSLKITPVHTKICSVSSSASEMSEPISASTRTSPIYKESKHAFDEKDLSPRNRGRGTSRLASFMASSPSHSATIFRRFDRINMRNLLMLENEIAELEESLDRVIEGSEEDKDISLELKEKVKEYYEAILLTTEMLNLTRPDRRALQETRAAIVNNRAAVPLDFAHHLNRANEKDLSVLAPAKEEDLLTGFFSKRFKDNTIWPSSPTSVTYAVTFFSTICAALFLIGAIVGLYFVSKPRARLAMISMFTLVFAGTIALLTNARRQDVFVATAAYAAVLVVFVSGNIAADPMPTLCVFENGNGAVNANADLSPAPLNTDVPVIETVNAIATITVTATPMPTETVFQSVMTVISTVVSQETSWPTAMPRKAGLSDFAKTGIGVGASVGALFCILVITCGIIPWVRRKRWREVWNFSGLGITPKRRDRRTRVEGSRGVWKMAKNPENPKGEKERCPTESEERDGRVVWV